MVGLLSPRSIWLTIERETPLRFATASSESPLARRASFRRAGRRVRISSGLVRHDGISCALRGADVNSNRDGTFLRGQGRLAGLCILSLIPIGETLMTEIVIAGRCPHRNRNIWRGACVDRTY